MRALKRQQRMGELVQRVRELKNNVFHKEMFVYAILILYIKNIT